MHMKTPALTRTGLRISTIEGCWATIHSVVTTGAFLTGFALFIGANDFQLAILISIPLLAQLAQLPGAYLMERTGWRKPTVAWNAFIGRLVWLPMALIPFMDLSRPVLVFIILFGLGSIAMNIAGPAWVSWMSDLVPAPVRGRYFGNRNRALGVATIAGSLAIGWMLDRICESGHEALGYLTIQGIGIFAAIMAFVLIRRQPEPELHREILPPLREYILRPMRNHEYRRVMAFFIYWLFAVGFSSPFFAAHLIKHMEWSFTALALLGMLSAGASILFHPFWGRMIDRVGHKPVLAINAIVIIHLPLYYAFCPYHLKWPILINGVITGIVWSGFNLATFNLLIHVMPEKGRAGYVALYSSLNGVITFASALLGGWVAHYLADFHAVWFGIGIVNYQVIFVIESFLRLPGLYLLRRIREPRAVRTAVVMRQAFIEINRRIGLGRQVFILPEKGGRRHHERTPDQGAAR